MERESVPGALTKDKKRVRDQEVGVHLAWQSTLYITNFPEVADDAYIRNLFGSVCNFSSSLHQDFHRCFSMAIYSTYAGRAKNSRALEDSAICNIPLQ